MTEESVKERIFSLLVLLSCGWACYFSLIHLAYYDGPSIKEAMTFSLGPPWQHRILFVLLARFIKAAFPTFTYFRCYALSQIVPVFFAFYFIKKWGELFIAKKLAFISQVLLVAILVPTFCYHNFWDVGVVFLYTASLYFLFKRRFLAYLFFFVLGVMNHDVTLLLIFIYLAIYFDSDMKKANFWGFALLQLLLFIAVHYALSLYLPLTAMWQRWQVLHNIDIILGRAMDTEHLLMVWLVPALWYSLAILGIRNAPKGLKRSLVLFPILAVMIFLFGQVNEVRLLNPFIPITIGLVLSFISSVLPAEDSTANML